MTCARRGRCRAVTTSPLLARQELLEIAIKPKIRGLIRERLAKGLDFAFMDQGGPVLLNLL